MSDGQAILLVRLDGVGDAALCVPALQGLSAAYPRARFGAVCSAANAQLFSDRVERVYVCDSPGMVRDCAAQLQHDSYTHALVATEEVCGYKLARASGARFRAGFWHGLQKPFKSGWQYAQLTDRIFRPAAWSPKPEHEVTTMYRLAHALGAKLPAPADPSELRSWLRIERSSGDAPPSGSVAFQITPKLLTHGWGPAALAEWIVTAARVSGLERCTLVAAAQDEGLACAIMEQVPTAARTEGRITLVSSQPLPRWLGFLADCRLIITPDTGAAHVAGMLGVPVIDLFESDGFERLSQQWRPWAAPARCLPKPRWAESAAESFGAALAGAVGELTA